MELDPEARRILSLVQDARTPSTDDKARVEQRLAVALGAAAAVGASTSIASPAAATSASGLTTKAAGSAAALKWTIGGCALIAAAVATYVASPGGAPSQAAPRRAAIAAPPAMPSQATPTAAVAPASAPAPAKPSIDAAEPPVDAAHPRRAQPHTRHARATLGDELELLHAAQSAWRSGDAARALALVSEHRSRHPRSTLGLERDALRVLSLCDLGRTEEAARLGRAWLTRGSASPLRASIERSCAMK